MEPFSTTTLFTDEQILMDRWWWDKGRFSDLVFALTKYAVIPKTDLIYYFICMQKNPSQSLYPAKKKPFLDKNYSHQ